MTRNLYATFVFAVLSLFFSGTLLAQEDITVKGKVSDTLAMPIPGVSIVVSGNTKSGVTTDHNGNYSITVKSNATLLFSSIGFQKTSVAVNGRKTINVTLQPDVLEGEEVVITAFGRKQIKEAVVGSVTSISPRELKIPASNLTSALAGRVAGLISFQGSGQPGQDNAKFFIRGVTTFGYRQDPLILIDNVELTSNDLARLQVDDIENFSVLKDASATALYGARGANGVILVTTKRGQLGKATINVRLESSLSQPTKDLEIADPITYMKLYNEAQTTRNPLAVPRFDQNKIYNTAATLKGEPGSNPYVYPAVDWLDMLFKKRASTQRANVSVSGGGDVATYYISGSYNVDNGILNTAAKNITEKNNVKLQNYQLRSNVDINITKTTKLSVLLWGNFTEYGGPLSGSGFATDLYYKALHTSPVLFPASFPADKGNQPASHILFGNFPGGSPNSINYTNPYADMMKGFQTYSESKMLAQTELAQKLDFVLPGLNFQGLFSTNRYSYFDYSRQYNPFYYTAPANLYDPQSGDYSLLWINKEPGNNRATEYLNYSPGGVNISTFILMRGILNYNNTFGKHGLSGALALVRQQTLNPNARNPAGNADLQYTLPYRNLNYTGRLSYSFMNKYFLEFNGAYNGSERFSKENRFGFFPTIGASWVISNEEFWKGGFTDVITRLKLRGSYGLVGNDAIGSQRFFYLSNVDLNGGNPAWFGYNNNNYKGGASIVSYPNPEVTWEKSKQTNVAIEATFFKDLNVTAELYKQYRYDILMSRTSIPSSVGLENQGLSPISANIGVADSRGLDLNINYKRNFGTNFWLSGLGNLTVTKSHYINYEEPNYQEPWRYRTGQPINQFYGFIAERLFVDDKEAAASPTQIFETTGKAPKGGDIKYRDMNGDGVINDRDMVPIGLPTTPGITYGFGLSAGYKNFDFNVFFNGNARVSFFVNPLETSPFVGETQLLKGWANSHWSEENQDLYALYPRLATDWSSLSNNTRASSWWLRNGSFIRVKSIEVGYSLPKTIAQSLRMTNLRIYFSGLNLLTFSKFKMWDPELGGQGFNYPIQKVFNLGLNVNL